MGTSAEQTERNKKAVLETLKKSMGIISTACEKAGIGRTTFYEYMKTDPEFKAEVEAINERSIDFVESKLFEKMSGVRVQGQNGVYAIPPSDTALIFYLKTKGKNRGYVERQEVMINPDQDIDVGYGTEDEATS